MVSQDTQEPIPRPTLKLDMYKEFHVKLSFAPLLTYWL